MSDKKTVIYKYGTNPINMLIGILAAMVSYYFNKSILWAIVHYFFGWIYLLYCLLVGRFADGVFMEILESYF